MKINLNNKKELALMVYNDNVAKGFWDRERHSTEVFALVNGEAFEWQEAYRTDNYANVEYFKERMSLIESSCNIKDESRLKEYLDTMFKSLFKMYIKDTFEDELADIYIRCLDYMGKLVKSKSFHSDGYDGEVLYVINYHLKEYHGNKSSFYHIQSELAEISYLSFLDDKLLNTYMASVELICKELEVDLEFHIENKLKYNQLRPYKHGKNS